MVGKTPCGGKRGRYDVGGVDMTWEGLSARARALLCSADPSLAEQEFVEVGDRFVEARGPHAVWRVERFVGGRASNIPHVIIERDGITPGQKIISTFALLDTRLFRRSHDESPEHAASHAPAMPDS